MEFGEGAEAMQKDGDCEGRREGHKKEAPCRGMENGMWRGVRDRACGRGERCFTGRPT